MSPGRPDPAADLEGTALDHFREIADTLQELELLSGHDSLCISEVSRIFGELHDVRGLIRETLDADEPDMARFTSLGVRRDALESLYSRHLKSLGLTPDSRGCIAPVAKTKPQESRWAEFARNSKND